MSIPTTTAKAVSMRTKICQSQEMQQRVSQKFHHVHLTQVAYLINLLNYKYFEDEQKGKCQLVYPEVYIFFGKNLGSHFIHL